MKIIRDLEPSAETLTTLPSDKTVSTVGLLECLDEDGGGFKFEYEQETKSWIILLFKPKKMDEVTFQRKVLQMTRAFNWTKMSVRRITV